MTMLQAQATAMLTMRLARVTTLDQAQMAVRRALRAAGLTHARTLRPSDMDALLQALAAEGGAVQAIAEQLAAAADDGPGPRAA